MSVASPLDETLDREVLLLLQGPNPEHMALEFRSLLNKLVIKRDYTGNPEQNCSGMELLIYVFKNLSFLLPEEAKLSKICRSR